MAELQEQLARATQAPGAPDDARRALVRAAERRGLVDVAYCTVGSPFGDLLVAATKKGLVHVAYPGDGDPLEEIARKVSPRLVESPKRLDRARRELDRYFGGKLRDFKVPIDWEFAKGFAGRVLKATANVPFGRVTTYRDVARAAGNVKATRAAGNALGANPVPIVVPCHRVLRTGGGLGGYTGGLHRKVFLLELEGFEASTL